MISDKEIAKVLRESIKKSTEERDVYGTVNGFQVILGTESVINGEKLKDRLEALISILEIGDVG